MTKTKGKKRVGTLARELILENLDFCGYDGLSGKNDKEKLEEVFFSEYGHGAKSKGLQKAVEDWLRGLPSCIDIPFYNGDILTLAKSWGTLPENATEKQEDKILDNYWPLMASAVSSLIKEV